MASSDICLIVEGGYPYQLGGVASWMDAFMRASPNLTFHVITVSVSTQSRVPMFERPTNLTAVTDVILDKCPKGRLPKRSDNSSIRHAVALMHAALTDDDGTAFAELINLLEQTGLGQAALLDSKAGWTAFEDVYHRTLPDGPLVEFFWSWRFLARSLLAVATTTVPDAKVFHAVATGFCGLIGVRAKHARKRPLVITEHGIYTNERRIELAVAEWLYESGAGGLGVKNRPPELKSVWMSAFAAFSRIAYAGSDVITTQYRANQDYQRWDGAAPAKLRIIPNGIDIERYAHIERSTPTRRPTVLMIGRIVPIKDTRTFIMAVSILKSLIPDVAAIIIGPENEDPAYAAGCRSLVAQFGLEDSLEFLARVPDVGHYLGCADVLALTSISEAQPIALLEAAASGLPAVVTDVGSCREIVEGFPDDPVNGAGGIVVEVCSPRAVAEALARILNDTDLRKEMGRVMKRRSENYYHKERVRHLYDSLYAELSPSDFQTSDRAPA